MTKLDLVSPIEIARRLGVAAATVHMWRFRDIFPKPDWELRIGPIWKWSTVEKWAIQTNRLAAIVGEET